MAQAPRDTAVCQWEGACGGCQKLVRIFSLQEVLEGVEAVKKGLEAEGEETDEIMHSESARALAMSSDWLQDILCKLFTKAQSLNYSDVSNH